MDPFAGPHVSWRYLLIAQSTQLLIQAALVYRFAVEARLWPLFAPAPPPVTRSTGRAPVGAAVATARRRSRTHRWPVPHPCNATPSNSPPKPAPSGSGTDTGSPATTADPGTAGDSGKTGPRALALMLVAAALVLAWAQNAEEPATPADPPTPQEATQNAEDVPPPPAVPTPPSPAQDAEIAPAPAGQDTVGRVHRHPLRSYRRHCPCTATRT